MILAERGSYVKPLITPTGDRIVFSRRPHAPGAPEVFIVNWDGIGPEVSSARASRWRSGQNPADDASGSTSAPTRSQGRYDFATVSRFPIDDPSTRELVWNKTLVSGDTFQVSADGRLRRRALSVAEGRRRRAAQRQAARSSATAAGRR